MSSRFSKELKEKWKKVDRINPTKRREHTPLVNTELKKRSLKKVNKYTLVRIINSIKDGCSWSQLKQYYGISEPQARELLRLYGHLTPSPVGVYFGHRNIPYYDLDTPYEHPDYQLEDLSPEELEILKNMAPIKLLLIDTMVDGTKRLQSQLYVGKTTADFVQEPDGVVKMWGNGEKGFDFYPYEHPYEIVTSRKEMARQSLV